MNRRNVIVGGAALVAAAAAPSAIAQNKTEIHPEKGETYKDLYWQAQTHIDNLELELSELHAHAKIMKKRASSNG